MNRIAFKCSLALTLIGTPLFGQTTTRISFAELPRFTATSFTYDILTIRSPTGFVFNERLCDTCLPPYRQRVPGDAWENVLHSIGGSRSDPYKLSLSFSKPVASLYYVWGQRDPIGRVKYDIIYETLGGDKTGGARDGEIQNEYPYYVGGGRHGLGPAPFNFLIGIEFFMFSSEFYLDEIEYTVLDEPLTPPALPPSVVPEPSAVLLVASGLIAIGTVKRRRIRSIKDQ